MTSELRPALVLLAGLTLLTGAAYPLLMVGVGQWALAGPANGSLLVHRGAAVGSAHIGQCWKDPKWFWGRPSAANCDGAASTGSNLGPSHPGLRAAVAQRVQALRAADPAAPAEVPVDLVTASASGLDPDISPQAALFQVARVARARGLAEPTVRALVDAHTTPRWLGLLGEAHVNVLRLNLALHGLEQPAAK